MYRIFCTAGKGHLFNVDSHKPWGSVKAQVAIEKGVL